MSRTTAKNTLPVTPIERFWLAEDTAGAYLSFFHRYELASPLNLDRVRDTIRSTANRHPLPFCRLDYRAAGQAEWVDSRSQFDPADRVAMVAAEPYSLTNPIDPFETCGIRVYVHDCVIWFQYHHTCADGRGALQLERDFFELYRQNDESPAVVNTDGLQRDEELHRLYKARTQVRLTLWSAIVRSTYGFWYLYRSMYARIRNVTWGQRSGEPGERRLACETRVLPVAESSRLRDRSKRACGLNDLVLTAVLKAVRRFEERAVSDSADAEFYRVVLPIDMRSQDDRRMPCANKMSLLYLDVPIQLVGQPEKLLYAVQRRMNFLKRHMGLVVWRSIGFGPRSIHGLRRYLHATSMSLTCYVSNLGNIDSPDSDVLSFEATPTLQHSQAPIGLMLYTFDDRLHLTVGFDENSVDRSNVLLWMSMIESLITSENELSRSE